MGSQVFRRIVGVLSAVSIAVLPLTLQPLAAAASSSGTLFAVRGETQVVSIDPSTGAMTTIADVTAPFPGDALGDLASDPATHQLFTVQTTWTFDPTQFPPLIASYQLVTIDTKTHALTTSPDLPQSLSLAFDPSTHTLFGLTQCCPAQIVRVDPSTGGETAVATVDGAQLSSMAVAPDTSSIYIASTIFGAYPPTGVLLRVNTITGAVTTGPSLGVGVIALAYDSSAHALFGKTFCCPTGVVRIDPSTGVEGAVGTFDLGYGNSLAVDPGSHTIFAMEDAQGAMSFDQFVASIDDRSGAIALSTAIPLNGYIRSLAFEGVAITPDSIKADVQSALASGAISNSGLATSLLAELNAASAARAHGQCATAANIYQAFINELSGQSGKLVASATASQLTSEAQFLIANCP